VKKPLELTPDVAIAFVEDMRAFFAEEDKHKQDEIAVRQLNALREHQGPLDTPLRLSDVKAMFLEMKETPNA
jgi:pyoverdine/dityrosine biosynthesis protein Dit1